MRPSVLRGELVNPPGVDSHLPESDVRSVGPSVKDGRVESLDAIRRSFCVWRHSTSARQPVSLASKFIEHFQASSEDSVFTLEPQHTPWPSGVCWTCSTSLEQSVLSSLLLWTRGTALHPCAPHRICRMLQTQRTLQR